MPKTLKQHLRDEIASNSKLFLDDLAAMPEDLLSNCPGGVARTPFDLTYEVAMVNRRITKRLKGEDPGAWSPMPWITAPEDYRTKEGAISDLQNSVDELLAAFDGYPEENLETKIPTGSGETTALAMANLAGVHAIYHDAQLNYLQTLVGDPEMHWKF